MGTVFTEAFRVIFNYTVCYSVLALLDLRLMVEVNSVEEFKVAASQDNTCPEVMRVIGPGGIMQRCSVTNPVTLSLMSL